MATTPYESLYHIPEHDDMDEMPSGSIPYASFATNPVHPAHPSPDMPMPMPLPMPMPMPMPAYPQQPISMQAYSQPIPDFIPQFVPAPVPVPMQQFVHGDGAHAQPHLYAPAPQRSGADCQPLVSDTEEQRVSQADRAVLEYQRNPGRMLCVFMVLQLAVCAVAVTARLELLLPFTAFAFVVLLGMIGTLRRVVPLVVLYIIVTLGVVGWLGAFTAQALIFGYPLYAIIYSGVSILIMIASAVKAVMVLSEFK